MASPDWLAARITVPTPVMVAVLPDIVAGPDFTLRVTGRLLLEVGTVTVNGEAPKVFDVMVANAPILWVAFDTVKLVVTSCAVK